LYNGKEEITDLDVNWYAYGARNYDAALGRFFNIDRFAEMYYDFTPYQYGANNPIKFIDVNGDSLDIAGDKEMAINDLKSLVRKKHRDRIDYDKETGEVSFNTEGLKRNKKGKLRGGSKMKLLDGIVNGSEKYLYEVSEVMSIQVGDVETANPKPGLYISSLTNVTEGTRSTTLYPDHSMTTNAQSPWQTGNWTRQVYGFGSGPGNSVMRIPPKGYDGSAATHPGLVVPGSAALHGASRKLIVGHVLGEMYYMTSGQMSRPDAHNKSPNGSYNLNQIYFRDKNGKVIKKGF
ncbi:RHS repeat-associated core domain-containing protein, partial [Fulvivirga lutimaris]|uniref:RHS repeat-associated core domain-containing protein n=1 Tax=Fulvivirga lutimaris TaxID=1819566 RepID=UPI002483F380